MSLTSFIKTNDITTFPQLKNILESDPYFLRIKEFPNSDLCIVTNNPNTNYDLDLCKFCNGIIFEKSTFNIVRFVNNKAIDNELVVSDKFDFAKVTAVPSYEGTLVSVYKHNGTLNYSTKRALDASRSKWNSSKSFKDLFLECWNYNSHEIDLNIYIEDNLCYNFIVLHPENQNVIHYMEPKLVLINVRKFHTLEEVVVDELNAENIVYLYNIYSTFASVDEFNEDFKLKESNPEYGKYEGVFLTDGCNTQKIEFRHFSEKKSIRPNSSNKFFSFLMLRKDATKLEQYTKLFPNEKLQLKNWELEIMEFAKTIHETYLSKHVYKTTQDIPLYLRTTVYKF